jgi:hypothetical protein
MRTDFKKKVIKIDADSEPARKQWKHPDEWSDRKTAQDSDVMYAINDLKKWRPLTIRQIHYRMIALGRKTGDHWRWGGKPIDVYNAIGPIIKWLRVHELLPWDYITDEHRVLNKKQGSTDIRECAYMDFKGYRRCNAQGQKRYIEIWLEKAALLHIVQQAADEFCLRVVICKGYSSFSFLTDFYERAAEAMSRGQIPTMLYFGDWDPSGEDMLHAVIKTIRNELGLKKIEYYRCGINPYHFPKIEANPIPIKPSDTRSKKFVRRYGTTAYELDSFHPEELYTLVYDTIVSFTDMQEFERNERIQREEIKMYADDLNEQAQRALLASQEIVKWRS